MQQIPARERPQLKSNASNPAQVLERKKTKLSQTSQAQPAYLVDHYGACIATLVAPRTSPEVSLNRTNTRLLAGSSAILSDALKNTANVGVPDAGIVTVTGPLDGAAGFSHAPVVELV